jgi:hypothetical protein
MIETCKERTWSQVSMLRRGTLTHVYDIDSNKLIGGTLHELSRRAIVGLSWGSCVMRYYYSRLSPQSTYMYPSLNALLHNYSCELFPLLAVSMFKSGTLPPSWVTFFLRILTEARWPFSSLYISSFSSLSFSKAAVRSWDPQRSRFKRF